MVIGLVNYGAFSAESVQLYNEEDCKMKIFNPMKFLSNVFSQMGLGGEKSGSVAKERLRLVLIHDQAKVSPELLETLRGEIIGVISKYMEIDSQSLEMGLEQRNGSVALAANIPIVRLRREKIAEALQNNNQTVTTLPQNTHKPLHAGNKQINNFNQDKKHIKRTRKFYSGKTKPLHQTTQTTT